MGRIGIGDQVDGFDFSNQAALVKEEKAFRIINGESNFHYIAGIFHIHFIIDILIDYGTVKPDSSFERTEKELVQLFLVDTPDRGLIQQSLEFLQGRFIEAAVYFFMIDILDKGIEELIQLLAIDGFKIIDQWIEHLLDGSIKTLDFAFGFRGIRLGVEHRYTQSCT